MANYKNQNVITDISVERIKHEAGETEAWMQPFSWPKVFKPLYLLSGNEFKFYMYIFSWAGKGEFEFSPAALERALNFKEDTARKVFKKFIEYGILKPTATHRYTFDPYPDTLVALYNKEWVEKYGPL